MRTWHIVCIYVVYIEPIVLISVGLYMLRLCALRKAVAFHNVLRFGCVPINVVNLFQSRVPM